MASLATFVSSGPSLVATVPGDRRVFVGTVAGPASYTTGGDSLDLTKIGLTSVDFVLVASAVAGTAFAVFNPLTDKFLIFTADGTQAASESDQSALIFPVFVYGV